MRSGWIRRSFGDVFEPLSRQTAQMISKFNGRAIHLNRGALIPTAQGRAQFRRDEAVKAYFGGHHGSVRSLSEIFIRVAYPVEAFGFKFVSNHPPLFSPGGFCDGSGKEPDLLEQLDDSETDEF